MAIVAIQNFIICFLATSVGADLHGQGFMAKNPTVHTDAIQDELKAVLSDVLGHGHSVTEDRLKLINATLFPIFRVLPKNNRGHVSEPIMRYALRRYFRASHIWIIKGFESEHDDEDVFNSTNWVNESGTEATDKVESHQPGTEAGRDILQKNVPGFVRSALAQKLAHQGFSLHDMVSMIAVLESLSFNEVVKAVEFSFHVNAWKSGASLTESELLDVLGAFLVVEMLEGANGHTPTPDQYAVFKRNPYNIYPNWDTLTAFLKDIYSSDAFGRRSVSNPFTVKTFVFEDVVRMAGTIAEEYGQASGQDCEQMKGLLFAMDKHETGRAKLSDFYKATRDEKWLFLEPMAYLRQLGALDESSEYLGPQVIISNYISGASNCITSSLYFSVCCPNDCDVVTEHIESEIPSPTGTVSQIVEALGSLSTFPAISEHMMNKLEEIATIGGGSIPLHGRLFAQWLHFAKPRECPYPHAVRSISPQVAMPSKPETQPASEDEQSRHIKHAQASLDPSPDAGKGMWDLQESTMDFSTPSDTEDANRHAWISKLLRLSSQVVLIGSFAALVLWEATKIFGIFTGEKTLKEYAV